MALTTIQPKSSHLPKFRESEAVYQALLKQSTKASITPSEAMRQILGAYLTKPFKLSSKDLTDGVKDRNWVPLRAEAPLVTGITKAAQKAGVSVGEAIRQILRRYLATNR